MDTTAITSVSTFDPNAPLVRVSEAAEAHFAKKLAAQSDRQVIRLSVKTSGCTGYAYVLDYVDTPQADDQLLQISERVQFAVATDAANFIRGTEIDLVLEGVNRVVKFNNPNVVAECGCGESFSVN